MGGGGPGGFPGGMPYGAPGFDGATAAAMAAGYHPQLAMAPYGPGPAGFPGAAGPATQQDLWVS